MTEERLEEIENHLPLCSCISQLHRSEVQAAVDEVRKLQEALSSIRARYEARDTGEGFPNGSLAWAMWRDAKAALEHATRGAD